MTTIGYARRSKERANGQLSLDDQEARIRAWAEFRGTEVAEIAREDDESGAVAPSERPVLGAVLERIGRGDVLVVAKFDRISRSVRDFAALLDRSRAEGWQLVCLDPEIDTTSPTGRAFAQMLSVFAEFERAQFVDRMQGGRRAKAEQGGYVGGNRIHRRFGSRLERGEDGRLNWVDVPDERRAIDDAVRRYREGQSLRAVAQVLGGKCRTPSGRRVWSPSYVAEVLRREGVQIRSRAPRKVAT